MRTCWCHSCWIFRLAAGALAVAGVVPRATAETAVEMVGFYAAVGSVTSATLALDNVLGSAFPQPAFSAHYSVETTPFSSDSVVPVYSLIATVEAGPDGVSVSWSYVSPAEITILKVLRTEDDGAEKEALVTSREEEIVRGRWIDITADVTRELTYRVAIFDGTEWAMSDPAVLPPVVGNSIAIGYARPSPFHGRVSFRIALPASENVQLQIIDAGGRAVYESNSLRWARGLHDLQWDGRSQSGTPAPTGVYFAVVRAGQLRRAVQVVLVR